MPMNVPVRPTPALQWTVMGGPPGLLSVCGEKRRAMKMFLEGRESGEDMCGRHWDLHFLLEAHDGAHEGHEDMCVVGRAVVGPVCEVEVCDLPSARVQCAYLSLFRLESILVVNGELSSRPADASNLINLSVGKHGE
jgi:hypothetical protein